MYSAITSNPDFRVITGRRLERNFGDLSQLGLERGRLAKDLQIPLVNEAIVISNAGGLAFELGIVDDEKAFVYFKFTNVDMRSKKVEGMDELLKALKPDVDKLFKDVMSDVEFKTSMEKFVSLAHDEERAIAFFLNSRVRADPKLRALVGVDVGAMSESMTATVGGEEIPLIDADFVGRMKASELRLVKQYFTDLDEMEATMFDRVILARLYVSDQLEESHFQHPLLKRIYSAVESKVSLSSIKIPAAFAEHFTPNFNLNDVDIGMHVSDTEVLPKDFKDLDFKKIKDETDRAIAAELCMFALSWFQILDSDTDKRCNFASTRTLVFRHGLYYDSQELSAMVVPPMNTDGEDFKKSFLEFFDNPEQFYVNLYVASISFLKTGHHASHPNLANMFDKIMRALGYNITAGRTERIAQAGIYYGTHPASVRLMIAYCLNRAINGNATGAIVRRLQVIPPTYAAYVNLELVISALDEVLFFELLNLKGQYLEFKRSIAIVKRTMHLCAPYSAYLYGETRPEPVAEKAIVARFAAYLVDLPSLLPNSSIVASPALRKLIDEATAVDFGSGLQVSAYVGAYKRFYRGLVQKQLAGKLGKNVSSLAITET